MNASTISSTYTSLIQQYISLMCYSNATFLAERFVSHNRSHNSLYLLAMCYYRSNQPKRARSILNGMGMASGGGVRGRSGESKEEEEDGEVYKSSRYLLAKCCLDLGFYREAE